jgi:hypothetical protein
VLPETPDVVHTDCDAEVNTTVKDADEVAETVKVSLE